MNNTNETATVKAALNKAGYHNVKVRHGRGTTAMRLYVYVANELISTSLNPSGAYNYAEVKATVARVSGRVELLDQNCPDVARRNLPATTFVIVAF